MKNILKFLTGIVLGFLAMNMNAQTDYFNQDEVLYVFAYNGLNLREDASLGSKVITKIDDRPKSAVLARGRPFSHSGDPPVVASQRYIL